MKEKKQNQFFYRYFAAGYTMMFRRFTFLFLLSLPVVTALSQVKTLEYYIREGLTNSPLLKDINNQIRSNSSDSLLLRATSLPQVKFNGTMMYAPIFHNYGYSEPITNNGNLITVVNVAQTIFNKKSLETQYKGIGLKNESLSNSGILTVKDLGKAITDQYLNLCSIKNEMEFTKLLIRSAREEEPLLKAMVEKGVFKQNDYLSFQIELQSQEFIYNDLQIQYLREAGTLKLLCGIRDTSAVMVALPQLVRVSHANPISPLFQRFKIDSLQIQNEKILVDRSYKPAFNWFSDAGLVNNDPAMIYKNFGFSLGMSLSVPVYDGNQRRLRYEKLKRSEETRQGYQDYFNRQYKQQLNDLNDELNRIRSMLPLLKKQQLLAETLVKQDKELLNIGSISITDIVLAAKNLISIRKNVNDYEVRMLRIINEMNYLEE